MYFRPTGRATICRKCDCSGLAQAPVLVWDAVESVPGFSISVPGILGLGFGFPVSVPGICSFGFSFAVSVPGILGLGFENSGFSSRN